MSEDRGRFMEAHNQRLRDARVLYRGCRWSGAVYMAGYAIECLLKALIVSQRGLPSLGKEHWHHDLRTLADKAGVAFELSRDEGKRAWNAFDLLCGGWQITLRYGARRYDRNSARRFLESVETVRKWLVDRII